MDNKQELFLEQIKDVQDHVPLNYKKAKLVFSNKIYIEDTINMKFVPCSAYNTTHRVVGRFSRPISKLINLSDNE